MNCFQFFKVVEDYSMHVQETGAISLSTSVLYFSVFGDHSPVTVHYFDSLVVADLCLINIYKYAQTYWLDYAYRVPKNMFGSSF